MDDHDDDYKHNNQTVHERQTKKMVVAKNEDENNC